MCWEFFKNIQGDYHHRRHRGWLSSSIVAQKTQFNVNKAPSYYYQFLTLDATMKNSFNKLFFTKLCLIKLTSSCTYLPIYLPTYLCTDLSTYLCTYLSMCLPTYLCTYLPTNPSMNLPTYLSTYLLPTYYLTTTYLWNGKWAVKDAVDIQTPIQIGTYVRDASQTTRTYSFFSTNRLGLNSLYVL